MSTVWIDTSPPFRMVTSRSRLVLDEQSFQGLLAAAFTIQEHNDKLSRAANHAAKPEPVVEVSKAAEKRCPRCAAPLKPGEMLCSECFRDAFHPVERSPLRFPPLSGVNPDQDQRPALSREAPVKSARSSPVPMPVAYGSTPSPLEDCVENVHVVASVPCQKSGEVSAVQEFVDAPGMVAPVVDEVASFASTEAVAPGGRWQRWWHAANVVSADAYLWLAIVVATVAILWPAPAPLQKPGLQPWQRILVRLGIAEAPPPLTHYRGDPNVQVWIDPHTALYYCPGEEEFAKTPNGRFAAQREAQLEQFEPAGRAVCQ